MIVGSNAILINRASLTQALQHWLDATVMESVDVTRVELLTDGSAIGGLVARVEFVPRPVETVAPRDVADDIRAAIVEQRALASAAFALDPALMAGLPPDCPIIPLPEPLPAYMAAADAATQEADHG